MKAKKGFSKKEEKIIGKNVAYMAEAEKAIRANRRAMYGQKKQ